MKNALHKFIRSTSTASATLMLLSCAAYAQSADYSWNSSGTNSYTTAASWKTDGATATNPPNYRDDNNIITPTLFGDMMVNTAASTSNPYKVNNFTVNSASDWIIRGAASGYGGKLDITGTLTKQGSGTLTFRNSGSAGYNLDLNIANISASGGILNFGQTSLTTYMGLNSLQVSGTTTIATNAIINVNGNTSASVHLGTINMAGGTLNVHQAKPSNTTPRVGGISASGINGTSGLIQARDIVEASRYVNATITLDSTSGQFNYGGVLADGGAGNTLALVKKGASTQNLSGANTYTGGTSVEAGTLKVSGSLAATGALSVSKNATFITANDLTVGNTTLADGAILGFDLTHADTSLLINGNLSLAGTFIIDFGGTGIEGQAYANLLSVTGTGASFGTISYINFGANKIGGELTASQLATSFSIGVIPEPATIALITGLLTSFAVIASRRRRG